MVTILDLDCQLSNTSFNLHQQKLFLTKVFTQYFQRRLAFTDVQIQACTVSHAISSANRDKTNFDLRRTLEIMTNLCLTIICAGVQKENNRTNKIN